MSTGHRMDTGSYTAAELDAERMMYQQAYANPVQFDKENIPAGQVPSNYNLEGPYPAKYDMPTPAKERMVALNTLRRTAPAPVDGRGTQMVSSITDDDVDYAMGMQKQSELAQYDRYVNALVRPRDPGALKFLWENEPDHVKRRIAQLQQDADFALRSKLIDMYGIQSKEDLRFQYLRDQGKIDGPQLTRPPEMYDDMYVAGYLAPWFKMRAPEAGVNLPFASAKVGQKPGAMGEWNMPDQYAAGGVTNGGRAPLSHGRDLDSLAQHYWGADPGLAHGGKPWAYGGDRAMRQYAPSADP